jgi:hypothetical protein
MRLTAGYQSQVIQLELQSLILIIEMNAHMMLCTYIDVQVLRMIEEELTVCGYQSYAF